MSSYLHFTAKINTTPNNRYELIFIKATNLESVSATTLMDFITYAGYQLSDKNVIANNDVMQLHYAVKQVFKRATPIGFTNSYVSEEDRSAYADDYVTSGFVYHTRTMELAFKFSKDTGIMLDPDNTHTYTVRGTSILASTYDDYRDLIANMPGNDVRLGVSWVVISAIICRTIEKSLVLNSFSEYLTNAETDCNPRDFTIIPTQLDGGDDKFINHIYELNQHAPAGFVLVDYLNELCTLYTNAYNSFKGGCSPVDLVKYPELIKVIRGNTLDSDDEFNTEVLLAVLKSKYPDVNFIVYNHNVRTAIPRHIDGKPDENALMSVIRAYGDLWRAPHISINRADTDELVGTFIRTAFNVDHSGFYILNDSDGSADYRSIILEYLGQMIDPMVLSTRNYRAEYLLRGEFDLLYEPRDLVEELYSEVYGGIPVNLDSEQVRDTLSDAIKNLDPIVRSHAYDREVTLDNFVEVIKGMFVEHEARAIAKEEVKKVRKAKIEQRRLNAETVPEPAAVEETPTEPEPLPTPVPRGLIWLTVFTVFSIFIIVACAILISRGF